MRADGTSPWISQTHTGASNGLERAEQGGEGGRDQPRAGGEAGKAEAQIERAESEQAGHVVPGDGKATPPG